MQKILCALVFMIMISTASATGFQRTGSGFCRSEINPKKYLNSILKDNTNNAQCKAKCESSVYCTGYAFAPTLYNGRCYNYGCPKLTSGLTEVSNYHANTRNWMAASGEMEDISSNYKSTANNNDATCYKKLYAECVRGVVNKKVCMCGRILAQHGDTCVKDDTISRGKPACTKERATEACACGDKVTCKKGLFCHGLDNPYYKQCKREQEGATTKAPVKKEQCTKEKATSPCLCGISGLITCKKGLYCHGELTGKSYFNQCRKEPEVIDTGEEVCLAGSTEMASDKLCDSSARQDLGFTGTDNPDDCGKLSMEDDRCHKTDGVAYFDFNPGYNGQCKCASDDKCSNGLYTDHGGYDVYSYKCPGGNTCAPMKNEKKCHKDKKCLWNRTKKKCGSAKHPFCKIGEKGSADCFCGRRGLVTCKKGKFCFGTPGDHQCADTSTPKCALSTLTKVTNKCSCGKGNTCSANQFCYKKGKKLGCFAQGNCVDSETAKTTSKCMCGGKACEKGKFCFNDKCSATGAAKCKLNAMDALTQGCTCGKKSCAAGQFCRQHKKKAHCMNYGMCDDDGANKITRKCFCDKKKCAKGKYCFNGKCRNKGFEQCEISPFKKNAEDCRCHGKNCAANKFCYKHNKNTKCMAQGKCAGGEVAAQCFCGKTSCAKGKFCRDGKCTKKQVVKQCAIKPNQKVARKCNCNGQQCGKGKFCFKLNNKLGCYASGECVDDGAHKVTQKCHCGDSPCPKGKYCFDGQCSATGNTPVCEQNEKAAIAKACKCKGKVCGKGKFCYNGKCGNYATCSADAVTALKATCTCAGKNCSANKYCYDGKCQSTPKDVEDWECQFGKNQDRYAYGKQRAGSKAQCQIACDSDPECNGFDFVKGKGKKSCRKYKHSESKYGTQFHGRVVCPRPGAETPECTNSGFVVVDCKCGESECEAGHYCMNDQCIDMGRCTGHGLVTTNCLCGSGSASPCMNGNYCLSTGECANKPPACKVGLNFHSCTCTDEICPSNNYCTAGECSATAPAKPACAADSMVIKTECNCGGEDCDSGKYCLPSGEGLDTCSEFPPKCSGSGATDIPCQCSNTVCKFGEHCYDDKCNSEPEACDEDEESPISATCMCSGESCAPGSFCYDGECNDAAKPPVCEKLGVSIQTECRCGESAVISCPVDYYCFEGGYCSSAPPSCTSDRDVIPIKNDCTCNGQFCEWGKFCWEGKCQVNPKPQIPLCDGESKTSEICMCEDNKCTPGQYCLEGECSNLPAACTEDEEDAITFECDCGGVHCASGFYCYDGKCNDAPKKPSCESDGVISVAEDCMCGEEDCDAGEYCYGGQCSPDPLACVEDAFVRVPTTCMCGEVACSGYCFDGLCEAEPREECTEGLVVEDEYPNSYKAPGQYFGFDNDAASTWFSENYGTTGYSKKEVFVITSRGYRGMMIVYKGSGNCGECGRFSPFSESAENDWEQGDIICKPKRDYGQDATPVPQVHTDEQCVTELQVTHGYPGGYRGKGHYFGIRNSCAEAWYGASNWHYKSVAVENINTGKTGVIKLLKDNDNCKQSCGRWDPSALADAGDWNIDEIIVKKQCVKGVAVEKNGACQCGETPCPEGKFCIGDQCLDEMPVVETECKSTPRPAEYLEVWPVKLDTTNEPGYYFEFDEAAGRKYFDQTPSWKYMGTFEFLNSCGETQDIKIIRNGGNCDNTGVPMQCGRINAHTTVSDDWQYEHVGENIGQSKWIALTSRLGGASEWAEFALADENVEFALAVEYGESAVASSEEESSSSEDSSDDSSSSEDSSDDVGAGIEAVGQEASVGPPFWFAEESVGKKPLTPRRMAEKECGEQKRACFDRCDASGQGTGASTCRSSCRGALGACQRAARAANPEAAVGDALWFAESFFNMKLLLFAILVIAFYGGYTYGTKPSDQK